MDAMVKAAGSRGEEIRLLQRKSVPDGRNVLSAIPDSFWLMAAGHLDAELSYNQLQLIWKNTFLVS